MAEAAPLLGRAILVTREERPDSRFERELTRLGAEVRATSLTRTAPPLDPSPIRDAAARLASYDWIVLTSGRAVKAFRVETRGPFDGPRWACVGPGTATALAEEFDRSPDLVPEKYDAESLARALIERDARAGLKVLFPAAENARPDLPRLLREAGCAVDQVVAYRIEPAVPGASALLPPPPREEWDAVVFTSGMAVQLFAGVLRAAWGEAGVRRFLEGHTAVLGLSAAEALRSLGVEPSIQAAAATMDDLLEALVAALAR